MKKQTTKVKSKPKTKALNKALVKRCTCPFENPKAHWEDRDMDGYDDTFVETKV